MQESTTKRLQYNSLLALWNMLEALESCERKQWNNIVATILALLQLKRPKNGTCALRSRGENTPNLKSNNLKRYYAIRINLPNTKYRLKWHIYNANTMKN